MTPDGKASVHVIWFKLDLTKEIKYNEKRDFGIEPNVKKSTASSSQVPKNRVFDVKECPMPTALEM